MVRTDITLPVGAVSQSVTIEATATAITTDEASVSEIVSTRAISDLPLNGRDPMQLATSTPGVLPGVKSSATGVPPGEDFNGAGTREIQNSMSLDGISIMNNLITTTPTRPMVESIQEVEVQTGTYSAQYGAYLGVHINMVTKSGTNEFAWRTRRIPAQPGARRARLLHPADPCESNRGQAPLAPEPVRL